MPLNITPKKKGWIKWGLLGLAVVGAYFLLNKFLK
jgi:hypothetical protein